MTEGFTPVSQLLAAPRPAHSVVAFDAERPIDWRQFQADVLAVQAWLQRQSSQRVGLCFADSYLFAVSFFAACHAEKSLVLPGNYQPEAVRELTPHFDVLLHDSAIVPAEDIQGYRVESRQPDDAQALNSHLLKPLDANRIELTLFTSGSSGKAKAIVKSLRQLEDEITLLESLWGEQMSGARIESTVSHQHIYGLLFRLLWPLCAARPFATFNLEFPEQVTHKADSDTVLVSSPALLKRLSEEQQSQPLRCLFSSGGPLPHQAALHSQHLFGQLPIEVFGSTETGGIAYRQQHQATTAWRLFPGVEAKLNSEGCLRLRAAHISGAEWYQTADQCQFHDPQTFDLKGRTDRVIKIEEKRISLVEVEQRLDQLEWIAESAVIALEQGNRLALCAVIVLSPQGAEQLAGVGKGKFWLMLRQALRDWLEPIAIPRKYRLVETIPLNSQGKRQVAEIEKYFQE